MGLALASQPTVVNGCFSLNWQQFEDHRGVFFEAFNEQAFRETGLPTHWPQDNISLSKASVLRGLHIQRNNPQGKLVRCISGRILDVCVDLRPDSPSFGLWHAELLEGSKALFCPPGTAHGFYSITESVVYYKCTTLYDKESDGGINPLDPKLAIPWEMYTPGFDKTILSDKDLKLPTLREYMERYNGKHEELLSAPFTGQGVVSL